MNHKLVRVTWIDAADPSDGVGWHSDAELDRFSEEMVEVVSVGFVKSDTKMYLTICADKIIDDVAETSFTWGRPTKIPHGMIVKVEELVILPPPPATQT